MILENSFGCLVGLVGGHVGWWLCGMVLAEWRCCDVFFRFPFIISVIFLHIISISIVIWIAHINMYKGISSSERPSAYLAQHQREFLLRMMMMMSCINSTGRQESRKFNFHFISSWCKSGNGISDKITNHKGNVDGNTIIWCCFNSGFLWICP